MKSLLIKDTTREEREQIVADSIGSIEAACDGCAPGVIEMYQAYIDGVKELREVNREYVAHYISGRKVRRAANAGCFNFMRGLFPSFSHVKAQQKGGYPTDSE